MPVKKEEGIIHHASIIIRVRYHGVIIATYNTSVGAKITTLFQQAQFSLWRILLVFRLPRRCETSPNGQQTQWKLISCTRSKVRIKNPISNIPIPSSFSFLVIQVYQVGKCSMLKIVLVRVAIHRTICHFWICLFCVISSILTQIFVPSFGTNRTKLNKIKFQTTGMFQA